ncbi:MAG: HDIG domain-containing metalloprotein [Planctomycetota bacterium]|jgi:putative nucleotidyltransferase with HDIG domain
MDRDQALSLLREYTSNPALIKHGLAVEAALRHYARLGGHDEERWGLVGLLHDFDYERWPEPPEHTQRGAEILRQRGLDEELVEAILSHAEWNVEQYPRDTPLRKSLFAVDELCGFLTAVALVRPERLAGLKPKSVKKKLKQKGFAAAVSREDIDRGTELLGLPLDEHIANCVTALQGIARELELEAPDQQGG